MTVDPLGLAGKVIKITHEESEETPRKLVREESESIEEKMRFSEEVLKAARNEKIRRKWDLME